MCLIAHRSIPGTHIPDSIIDYNLRINPDGFGIAWRDEKGSLVYIKYAPSEAQQFRAKLKAIDESDAEYVAHWRRATHGELSREMSHPFQYTDPTGHNFVAFHNGIIPVETKGNESDTAAFVRKYLARMATGWWKDNDFRKTIEKAIGWSRILLWSNHFMVKLNEKDWKMVDSIDYSTYPGPTTYTYTGPTTGTGMYNTGWSADDSDYDEPWQHPWGMTSKRGVPSDDQWKDNGHTVVPITRWDTLDPTDPIKVVGDVKCLDCDNIGEYLIMEPNRTPLIDVDHVVAVNKGKLITAKERKGDRRKARRWRNGALVHA